MCEREGEKREAESDECALVSGSTLNKRRNVNEAFCYTTYRCYDR